MHLFQSICIYILVILHTVSITECIHAFCPHKNTEEKATFGGDMHARVPVFLSNYYTQRQSNDHISHNSQA